MGAISLIKTVAAPPPAPTGRRDAGEKGRRGDAKPYLSPFGARASGQLIQPNQIKVLGLSRTTGRFPSEREGEGKHGVGLPCWGGRVPSCSLSLGKARARPNETPAKRRGGGKKEGAGRRAGERANGSAQRWRLGVAAGLSQGRLRATWWAQSRAGCQRPRKTGRGEAPR